MTFNTSFQPLLACKVSFEKSADNLMGTPLQVTVSFSLAAFKILSASLILVNVIMMCLGHMCAWSIMCASLGPTSLRFSELPELPRSLFPLPDWGLSPSLFVQISFKFLLFLFSFWHPYDSDVGTFKVVLEVPKPLLIFLNSCFFILFQLDICIFLLV